MNLLIALTDNVLFMPLWGWIVAAAVLLVIIIVVAVLAAKAVRAKRACAEEDGIATEEDGEEYIIDLGVTAEEDEDGPAEEDGEPADVVAAEQPAEKPAEQAKPAAQSKPAEKTSSGRVIKVQAVVKPAAKPAAETKPAAAPAEASAQPAADNGDSQAAKSAGPKVYHITKRLSDGKWQIKFNKGKKAIKLFDTQLQAIEYAKALAVNQDASIMIHKEDGSFRRLRYDKPNK